jgi:predicted nucleic acid-binding protein
MSDIFRYVISPLLSESLGVLDAGEQAVLALALKHDGCTVVLDDARGRAGADALGIPKIGTLGVVLRAHKQGHITMMAPVVRALMGVGLYLDQTVIQKVLASVGEKWP